MIVIMSLWRNDADRDLEARAEHLLSKTSAHHALEWHWVVGDSDDNTLDLLCETAVFFGLKDRVRIQIADTGIEGTDTITQRRRGSATASAMFAELDIRAQYAVLHESDLRSAPDVLDALINTPLCVEPNTLEGGAIAGIAGWPTINLDPRRPPQFYDTWAYRDLRGQPFAARPPYARGWQRNGAPFQVGSFGSVWMVPAEILRGRQIESRAVVELCEAWRAEGIDLWVAPEIPIEQPTSLWTP